MSQAIRTVTDRRTTSEVVTSRSIHTVDVKRVAVVNDQNIAIRTVQVSRVGLQATTRQALLVETQPRLVSVALAGIRGPASGSSAAYTHTQTTPSSSWTVAHNLGRQPNVYIVIANELVEARVTYPNNSSALVEFATAQTGKAYCH